jgi:ribonuclease E
MDDSVTDTTGAGRPQHDEPTGNTPDTPPAETSAPPAGDDDLVDPTVRPAAKKRRRGSRGGKGRKRPAATGDAAGDVDADDLDNGDVDADDFDDDDAGDREVDASDGADSVDPLELPEVAPRRQRPSRRWCADRRSATPGPRRRPRPVGRW